MVCACAVVDYMCTRHLRADLAGKRSESEREMRLNCEVEVGYSLAMATGGVSSRSSRTRAAISLGKKAIPRPPGTVKPGEAGTREELYFIVSTAKNVAGTKYKIKNNITKMFCKFLREGKATIKFKEPAHDVSISKADPTKLRELLNVLRLSPKDQKDVSLAPLLPTKMQDIERPKTKLVVKSRGDYPIKGFPPSLETLEAVSVSLNRVDLRILRLSSLQYLDLSNNSIKVLPDEMKDVSLVELRLAGNKLKEVPDVLCSGELARSLRLLDLTRNGLVVLPHSFPLFKGLVQLKLDCNELRVLPRSIGKMSSLKFFSASNNKLVVLPPSFPRMSLESLDLFGNPFTSAGLVRRCLDLSLPPLQELAGRAIKKHRISYDPYSLPVVLCHYLDSAKKCLCGKACFQAFLHHIALLNLHKVSATVTAVDRKGTTQVPVEAFLCSAKCLKLWKV